VKYRKEQAGMYLRNQNIRDKAFDDQYKKRAECEKNVKRYMDILRVQ
jgi:hypothetical protein